MLRATFISIFASSREATNEAVEEMQCILISTHDLARRSTLAIVRDEQVCYYFNSRPHEEVDCSAFFGLPALFLFQLTT